MNILQPQVGQVKVWSSGKWRVGIYWKYSTKSKRMAGISFPLVLISFDIQFAEDFIQDLRLTFIFFPNSDVCINSNENPL